MNIKIAGAISTSLVIAFSILFIIPPYISHTTLQPVLLSFTITDKEDPSKWCQELSNILNKHNVKAVVFLSGSIAEQFPECVTSFSENIDIGSQGYNNVSISKINDYSQQLEEITRGKQVIDKIGNLNSKIYSSPDGKTDQNIYSLLEKSGIKADFSYEEQYNIFLNGKFLWFKIKSYEINEFGTELIPTKRPDNPSPIMINIKSNYSMDKISEIISDLKDQKISFINPSDLAGFDLTERGKK